MTCCYELAFDVITNVSIKKSYQKSGLSLKCRISTELLNICHNDSIYYISPFAPSIKNISLGKRACDNKVVYN